MKFCTKPVLVAKKRAGASPLPNPELMRVKVDPRRLEVERWACPRSSFVGQKHRVLPLFLVVLLALRCCR